MTEVIVKLIGSVALLVASLYYGQVKIRGERVGIKEVASLAEMVKYIGERIEHFSQPLPEIFAQYRNDHLESIGFLPYVRTMGISGAVENCRMTLDGDDRELFLKFAGAIGRGYRDEELSLCRYTYTKLTESEDKMRAAIKDKEKLYRTIPPMLALSVILILI